MARKPPLTPATSGGPVPLSFAQEGLWFLSKLNPVDIAYTVPLVLRLAPQVSREEFEAALTALVARHEPLRTSIQPDRQGLPTQKPGTVYTPPVIWHDRIDETAWNLLVTEELRRPFDLAAGRPARGIGCRLDDGGHRVCLMFHHIVADGWSLGIIARDLEALYAGRPLPELPIRYSDFSVWERGWSGDFLPPALAYWRQELTGAGPLLLPTDLSAGPESSAAADKVIFEVPQETTAALLALGRAERATGFAVTASLFAALLSRWSGQPEVLLGSTVAGRNAPGLSDLVGHFVNTVALRLDFSGSPTFREVLGRTRRKLLDSMRYDAPFHHVVAEVAPRRNVSRHPLVNVVITHQEFLGQAAEPRECAILAEPRQATTAVSSHFDLDAETIIRDGRLSGMLLYRSDLFHPAGIERFRDHMLLLARRVTEAPDIPLSDVDLGASRPVVSVAAPSGSIPELLDRLAQRRPDQAAVVTAKTWMTFGELAEMSVAEAHLLRARGVRPGSVVAVFGPWRPEAVVTGLALMRCGAAVLMLDPADPQERIAEDLAACGATLITDVGGGPGEPAPVNATDVAVVALSPQGPVAVTHHNLVRAGAPSGSDGEVMLLDPSPLLPWSILSAGGTCVFAEEEAAAEFVRHAPSSVCLTAEQAVELASAGLYAADLVTVSGDPEALAMLDAGGPVRRSYHRPECGGAAMVGQGRVDGLATLGQPVAGTVAYLLDERLNPVAPGMVGDLYLGGPAVALGYLGRAAATAERFLPDPFAGAGRRMFRSGERGFLDLDGNVRWLSRQQPHVTVDGVRVDLAAVEKMLSQGKVAMLAQVSGGRTTLIALAESAAGELTQARLRPAERPGQVRVLDALPDSRDRAELAAGLREPVDPADDGDPELIARYERIILDVWERVLGNNAFGTTDSFFDVGGHSLLVLPVLTGIRDETGVELPLVTIFGSPTVRELAREVASQDSVLPPLRGEDDGQGEGRQWPLAFGQEALWLMHEIGDDSSAFNVPLSLHLPAGTDEESLAAAVATLVRRHNALRTRFETDSKGRPCQVVIEPYVPEVRRHDLSSLTGDALARKTSQLLGEMYAEPFDLAAGRLVRGIAIRHGDGCHLILIAHHIAVDGSSRSILARELTALVAGEDLPEPAVSSIDFARWQRTWLTGSVLEARLDYWRRRFDGVTPFELPADAHRRSLGSSTDAGLVTSRLSAATVTALAELAASERTTIFAALAAAVAAHLADYARQAEVVLGTVFTGRIVTEMTDAVGLFANTALLRATARAGDSFRGVLRRMRTEILGAAQHQDVPYELVMGVLGGHREGGRNPLTDAVMVYHDEAGNEMTAAVEQTGLEPKMGIGPRFAMELHISRLGDGLAMAAVYRSELFDRPTMQAFLDRLSVLVTEAIAAPEQPLSSLDLSGPLPAGRLAMSAGQVVEHGERSVVAMVERQVARDPEAIAVVGAEGTLTYRELSTRANQVAWHLRSRGVGRGSVVAVCHVRNADLVVVLLGILKAGAAYLALDPTHPLRRIFDLIEAADPQMLITSGDLERVVPPGRIPVLRYDPRLLAQEPTTAPEVEIGPDDLLNVIFTSGSTGVPKGVGVTHGGVANLVISCRPWLDLVPGDRMAQMSPLTFDVSTWELWSPLATGAATVAVQVDALAGEMDEIYREYGVTITFLVPAQLDLVISRSGGAELDSVRAVVMGGDIVSPASFQALCEKGRPEGVVNAYGPTESTVMVSVRAGDDFHGEPVRGQVTIGRPITNMRLYVMDRSGRPAVIGAYGEIFIGGPQVATGYLGGQRLTAEKFVPDPYGPPGARLYRTGDLGRMRADGLLEFYGRIDTQVKVRGFRIELGEIEAVMAGHPGVSRAAAAVRKAQQGPTLVAYYIPDRAAPADPEDLRRYLADRLPPYEIPASLTVVDELPTNRNGKIDRAALPEPAALTVAAGRAPTTQLEMVIAGVWSGLLSRPVSIDDNFFAVGGHSLLVVYATNALREQLGREVPLRLLFENPTVSRYAQALQQLSDTSLRRGTVEQRRWNSPALGVDRRVDLYIPQGFDPATCHRLLVMFDGSDFVDVIRAPVMLDELVEAGRIPPTPALFVSHPDWNTRNAELEKGLPLVHAVVGEAIELARQWLGEGSCTEVIFGGSSLGAAAAATAAVSYPDLACGLIGLAGPFWWSPEGEPEGWLVRRAGELAESVRCYLFAVDGDDPRIREWTGVFHAALIAAGRDSRSFAAEGGHNFATWQAQLPHALATILGDG